MYKNKQKEDNHINRISIKLNKNILHIESNPLKQAKIAASKTKEIRASMSHYWPPSRH